MGCGLRTSSRFWLRPSEAKRLMLNEHLDAARAALHIGYESPSPFSRESGRRFGGPPKRDIDGWHRRADPSAVSPAAASAGRPNATSTGGAAGPMTGLPVKAGSPPELPRNGMGAREYRIDSDHGPTRASGAG